MSPLGALPDASMNSPSSRFRPSYHDADEFYHRNRISSGRMDDQYVGPPLGNAKVAVIPTYDQNDYSRQTVRRKISSTNNAIDEPYTYIGQRNAWSNCDKRAFDNYTSDRTVRDASNRFDTSSHCTYGTNSMRGDPQAISMTGDPQGQSLRRGHHIDKANSHVTEERQRFYVRNDTTTRRRELFPQEIQENDSRNYRSNRLEDSHRVSHLSRVRNADDTRSNPPSVECNDENTVEISPGEFLRLRSTNETWDAVLNDFYMPCMCVSCEITLFCIQDACCVVCPACREISPLDVTNPDGGVGLGLTLETLAKWQDEIQRLGRRDHSFGR
jgi:hypothetical protein